LLFSGFEETAESILSCRTVWNSHPSNKLQYILCRSFKKSPYQHVQQ